MNNEDCIEKCYNYQGCKMDLEHFENKSKEQAKKIDKLENALNVTLDSFEALINSVLEIHPIPDPEELRKHISECRKIVNIPE